MKSNKLKKLKLIHTIIWYFYLLVFCYILIDLVFNLFSVFLWICIGLVFLEGIILLFNGWRCPITIKAKKLNNIEETGFDIYLPKWLAKNNKLIFSIIFFIELIILLYRLIT